MAIWPSRIDWSVLYKFLISVYDLFCDSAGALVPQMIFSSHIRERTLLNTIMLTHSYISVLSQLVSVGSAGLTFFTAIPMLLAFIIEPLFHKSVSSASLARERPSLVIYAIGQTTSLLLGAEVFCAITDVFVPLVCTIEIFLNFLSN